MNNVTKEITIELGNGEVTHAFDVQQYDANVWELIISLTKSGKEFIPSAQSISLWARKPDGTKVQYTGSIVDGKTKVNIGWQAFVCVGRVYFSVKYVDSNQELQTPCFYVNVYESPQSDAVVSTSEYDAIEKSVEEADAAKTAAASSAEASSKSAGAAADSETNAKTSETNINDTLKGLNTRIDNLVANNNPTEGNTELIDIRTGQNGTAYASAGAAVRGQISELNETMAEKTAITTLTPTWAGDLTVGDYRLQYRQSTKDVLLVFSGFQVASMIVGDNKTIAILPDGYWPSVNTYAWGRINDSNDILCIAAFIDGRLIYYCGDTNKSGSSLNIRGSIIYPCI